ncbi:hypothetical protein [Methylobacillus sp.]
MSIFRPLGIIAKCGIIRGKQQVKATRMPDFESGTLRRHPAYPYSF